MSTCLNGSGTAATGAAWDSGMSNAGSPGHSWHIRGSAALFRRMALLLLAAGLLTFAAPVSAATPGTMGAVSRGSITISVSVAPRVTYTASTVRAAMGEDQPLLELACLQLTSRTGGYQLSRVEAATGEIVQMTAAQGPVRPGILQERPVCRRGADVRWLIGPAADLLLQSRPTRPQVEVLLVPL